MKGKELYDLVKNFYGYKINMIGYNSSTSEVSGILYDSFLLKCDTNDRYERFGCGLFLDNSQVAITNFLGKRCSLNSDKDSIEESLELVDNYCRLRLPDKFLKSYENTNKKRTK